MNRLKFLAELGIENYKIVCDEEAIKIAHRWLSVYCPKRTSFKGIYRYKTYVWDEMGCDLQKEQALLEYQGLVAHEYVIMEDCFGHDNKELYTTKQKPKDNVDLEDFHVFPKNMAWSMSFTHEDGWIGPLFSKHKEYEKLNKKTSDQLQLWSVNTYKNLKQDC